MQKSVDVTVYTLFFHLSLVIFCKVVYNRGVNL
nr:MAG TPA: hypothetical protein [Caudoviricetes sp.]